MPEEKAGITVTGWQIDRYVTLYDAVDKMLSAQGYRLQISYVEPETLIMDTFPSEPYRSKLFGKRSEYSQDGEVQFTVKDYRGGVNHLICAGKGQTKKGSFCIYTSKRTGASERPRITLDLKKMKRFM